MVSLMQIFDWFKAGLIPSETQFRETWSSFWHKSERLPLTQVLGLNDEFKRIDDTKATKDDLRNVVSGLNPMGEALNMADLNTKPKRNNDSYFVLDQLDENGDTYIFRYDAELGQWVNTKQVVYQDVARKSDLSYRAENYDVYSIEGGYYFKGSEGEIGRINASDLSIITDNPAWRVAHKSVIKGKRYTFYFPKTSASDTIGVICACDDTGTILSVINKGQVGAGEYYSISLIPQVNIIALSLNFNYANKPYFIVDESLEIKKSFESIAIANETAFTTINQAFDVVNYTQIIGVAGYFGALINFRASRLYFEGFAPVSMVLYSDYAPLTQYGIKAITGDLIVQESANKWYVDLSAENAKMIGINFNRVEPPIVKVYYSESLENNQLVITEKLYNVTYLYKFAGREGKIGYVSQSNLAIVTNNADYRLVYLKVIQGKRYYFKFAATPTQSNVAVICKCDADGNIISSMLAGTNGTAGTYYEVSVIPQSDIIAVTINIAYQNKPYFRIDEENELIKSFRSEATANESSFNFFNQAFSRTTFQQIIGQANFWGGVLNFRPKKLYFKGSAPSTIILYSDYLPVTKNGVKYYETFTNEGNGIWSIDLTAEIGVKMVALNFNYASATPPTTFDVFYQDAVKYRLNGLDTKTDITNVAVQQLNDRLTEAIENMEGGIPNVILKDFYALGASSTEGTVTGNVSWVDKLAAKVAFNSVHKLAVGGSTILYDSGRTNLIDQIGNIPASSEGLITLMIGANDILLNHDMGDADAALALPSNQLNNTTNVAIAYRYAIETIINKCPKAIILELQLNPMQGYDAKVTELAEIKRKICKRYGIKIIETFLECGINSLNWSTYQVDEIHPNLDGQERIAMYQKGEFLRFMF